MFKVQKLISFNFAFAYVLLKFALSLLCLTFILPLFSVCFALDKKISYFRFHFLFKFAWLVFLTFFSFIYWCSNDSVIYLLPWYLPLLKEDSVMVIVIYISVQSLLLKF